MLAVQEILGRISKDTTHSLLHCTVIIIIMYVPQSVCRIQRSWRSLVSVHTYLSTRRWESSSPHLQQHQRYRLIPTRTTNPELRANTCIIYYRPKQNHWLTTWSKKTNTWTTHWPFGPNKICQKTKTEPPTDHLVPRDRNTRSSVWRWTRSARQRGAELRHFLDTPSSTGRSLREHRGETPDSTTHLRGITSLLHVWCKCLKTYVRQWRPRQQIPRRLSLATWLEIAAEGRYPGQIWNDYNITLRITCTSITCVMSDPGSSFLPEIFVTACLQHLYRAVLLYVHIDD